MVFFSVCIVAVLSFVGVVGAILFHNLIVSLRVAGSKKAPRAFVVAVGAAIIGFSMDVGVGLAPYEPFAAVVFHSYLALLLILGVKALFSLSQLLRPLSTDALLGLFIGVSLGVLILLDLLRFATGVFSV